MVRCIIFSLLSITSLQAISQVPVDLKLIENKIKKTNKLLAKEFGAIKLIPGKLTVDSFYISPREVTNKQYREFLEYIQDSILRKLMGYVKQGHDGNEYLDYSKKISVKEIKWIEKSDGLPQKVFMNTNGVMHFYPKYFVYSYRVQKKWIQISVMPDTSFWNYANSSSTQKPPIANYLWLSGYDNYAIKGVNFYKAQAYCHWKTQQLKATLDNSYDLDISILLPTTFQWKAALISRKLTTNTKKAMDEATGFTYIVSFKRKTE